MRDNNRLRRFGFLLAAQSWRVSDPIQYVRMFLAEASARLQTPLVAMRPATANGHQLCSLIGSAQSPRNSRSGARPGLIGLKLDVVAIRLASAPERTTTRLQRLLWTDRVCDDLRRKRDRVRRCCLASTLTRDDRSGSGGPEDPGKRRGNSLTPIAWAPSSRDSAWTESAGYVTACHASRRSNVADL